MIKHIFKLIWNKKGSNALMILEIFLSFMVLFFVLTYTYEAMSNKQIYRGFETEDRLMIHLDDMSQYDSLESRRIRKNLKLELQSLPQIEKVAMMGWCNPYSGSTSTTDSDDMGFNISSYRSSFDHDFADAINLKMVAGRWFTEEDINAAYEPIVVTSKYIEEYFEGNNMIDSIIQFAGERRIVGVAENYKYEGDFATPFHMTFSPIDAYSEDARNVMLKMKPGTSSGYEEEISRVVNANLGSTGSIIRSVEKARRNMDLGTLVPLTILLSICGFLALNVALGLFGILWYNINKRRGEIGLRRAVGAHTSDITWQFILEILILTGISLVLGIFFAIQFPLLDILPVQDAYMYKAIIISTLVIIGIVLLCAFYPSIQAAKIQPATALHED